MLNFISMAKVRVQVSDLSILVSKFDYLVFKDGLFACYADHACVCIQVSNSTELFIADSVLHLRSHKYWVTIGLNNGHFHCTVL